MLMGMVITPPVRVDATITLTDSDQSGTDLTTYTFSSKSWGTAGATRRLILTIVGAALASRTISSVTVGGNAATQRVTVENLAIDTYLTAAVFTIDLAAGTSGDVVVTWSAGMVRCGIGVFAAYDLLSAVATDSANASGDPASTTSCDIQAGGVAVACAIQYIGSNQTWTWTGLTERYDAAMGDTLGNHSGAGGEFSSAQVAPTITADPTGSSIGVQMVVAAFR